MPSKEIDQGTHSHGPAPVKIQNSSSPRQSSLKPICSQHPWLSPSPWQPLALFCVSIASSRVSHKWSNTVCNLLGLVHWT